MDSAARWLWRVAGRKKAYVLALTLIQTVGGGLGVLYALLLRNIVDSAVGHDGGAFRHNVVLIAALVVLQISLSAVVRWLNELARADIENRFKQRLTDNILRKEYSAVSATHTAEWLNRLTNDTTVVANGIVEILPGLTGTIVRLVSAVIMVISLDRMFAAILVPGGVVLASAAVAEAALGFTPERYAIMIAVYMALDGMGTACNLTGDGAIALIVDRLRRGGQKDAP
jgi:ATP-binding cassette subfamily B protein